MTKPLSIETIIAKQLCTGCGACAALSGGRVQMRETLDSNRRPDFGAYRAGLHDATLARACPAQEATVGDYAPTGDPGQSRQSSPSNPDHMAAAFGTIIEIYEGYAADAEIRHRGSSGGAVTALALASLGQDNVTGVLHIGASNQNPVMNEARISRSRAALTKAAGSRYAPASIADKLPALASEAGQVTVIGKPCDIAGAKRVADRDPMIAASMGASISLLCAGTPNHQGTRALLDALGAPKTQIDSVRYRGHGWPGDMTAIWRQKDKTKQATMPYEQGWGDILQAHRQWRCYLCADHTGELADIAVGDPWQRPTSSDQQGRSLIIIRTEKGRSLLRHAIAAGHLIAEPVALDTLAKAQPNLRAAKANAFGRRLAMKLMGISAPSLRKDAFRCWMALPLKAKVQSVFGTWKRLKRKGLYQNHTPRWYVAAEDSQR